MATLRSVSQFWGGCNFNVYPIILKMVLVSIFYHSVTVSIASLRFCHISLSKSGFVWCIWNQALVSLLLPQRWHRTLSPTIATWLFTTNTIHKKVIIISPLSSPQLLFSSFQFLFLDLSLEQPLFVHIVFLLIGWAWNISYIADPEVDVVIVLHCLKYCPTFYSSVTYCRWHLPLLRKCIAGVAFLCIVLGDLFF